MALGASCRERRERRVSHYRFFGGSMRIGNRLGGTVFWSLLVSLSVSWASGLRLEYGQACPRRRTHTSQNGDRFYGDLHPRRVRRGMLTIKTSSGTVSTITGPDGRERQNGQDVGMNSQGWYSFAVSGATGPTRWKPPSSRSVRVPVSPGTSTTGPPSPTRSTSPGPAATPGSTRCTPSVTTRWSPPPAATSPPARISSRAGLNGPARDARGGGGRLDLVPESNL